MGGEVAVGHVPNEKVYDQYNKKLSGFKMAHTTNKE